MSRAPEQLAPSWLPRQRRRHVDRHATPADAPDACSVCGNLSSTTHHGERLRYARQCCAGGRVLHRPGRYNLRRGIYNVATMTFCCRAGPTASLPPTAGRPTRLESPTRSRPTRRSSPKLTSVSTASSGAAACARQGSTCSTRRGSTTTATGSSRTRHARTASVRRSPASMTLRRQRPHPDRCCSCWCGRSTRQPDKTGGLSATPSVAVARRRSRRARALRSGVGREPVPSDVTALHAFIEKYSIAREQNQ